MSLHLERRQNTCRVRNKLFGQAKWFCNIVEILFLALDYRLKITLLQFSRKTL